MTFSEKIVTFIGTALKNSRFRHLSTFLLNLSLTNKTQCNALCFTKERTAIPSPCFEINFVHFIILQKALMLSKTLVSNIGTISGLIFRTSNLKFFLKKLTVRPPVYLITKVCNNIHKSNWQITGSW